MDNLKLAPKGFNWLKPIGILAALGVIVAAGRIILRVFREKPEQDHDDHEHHEAA